MSRQVLSSVAAIVAIATLVVGANAAVNGQEAKAPAAAPVRRRPFTRWRSYRSRSGARNASTWGPR